MQTHKDLEVWQLGIEMVEDIYVLTNKFPKEEMYGLTSQIRRAAVSIPSNIAEGAARRGNAEFIQFLYIALGSMTELETQLIIAQKLKYIDDTSILDRLSMIGKKLVNLIKYHKSKS